VAVAQNLMSYGDCYVLEVAALLHDIGKIGVPDAILSKPGPLTDEEWKTMAMHDRMGVEIVSAAFASHELTNILACHHAFFAGSARDTGLPSGFDIPLRARILSIADAFDAMVTDRPFRKQSSVEAAAAELRRCAGTQFDPELVELFIQVVASLDTDGSGCVLSTPVETAMRIGLEIERLSAVLAARDFSVLGAMANRLAAVATELELPHVAELAAKVSETVASGCEPELLLQRMNELTDHCHSIQNQVLSGFEPSQRGPSAAPCFDDMVSDLVAPAGG